MTKMDKFVLVISIVVVGAIGASYAYSYRQNLINQKKDAEAKAVQAQLKQERQKAEMGDQAKQAQQAPQQSAPTYTAPPAGVPDLSQYNHTADIPNSVTPPTTSVHCSTYYDAMGIAQTTCY